MGEDFAESKDPEDTEATGDASAGGVPATEVVEDDDDDEPKIEESQR